MKAYIQMEKLWYYSCNFTYDDGMHRVNETLIWSSSKPLKLLKDELLGIISKVIEKSVHQRRKENLQLLYRMVMSSSISWKELSSERSISLTVPVGCPALSNEMLITEIKDIVHFD